MWIALGLVLSGVFRHVAGGKALLRHLRLSVAGYALVAGGITFGHAVGVSEALIGLTIVASSTGCKPNAPGRDAPSADKPSLESNLPDQLRWAPPPCALTYTFTATIGMRALDRPGDPRDRASPAMNREIRIDGGFRWTADKDRVVIHNDELRLRHVLAGRKAPAFTQPQDTLAPVRLRIEASQLVEEDGPTSLWSAYGTFPGLALFFPALPDKASEATWTLIIHPQRSAIAVEARRGTVKLPKNRTAPSPGKSMSETVNVRGVRGLTINEAAAAELSASWTTSSTSAVAKAHARTHGRYIVLASGRLFAAAVDRSVEVEMRLPTGEKMRQEITLLARAQLVDACDGPTAPRPSERPSAVDERLLEALVKLRTTLALADGTDPAQLFAPAVIEAHGSEKIRDVLQRHVDRYGTSVLGAPEIFISSDVERDQARVHLIGTAERWDNGEHGMTVNTIARGSRHEGAVRIDSIGTDTIVKDGHWKVLEVSADRLFSAALTAK